MLLFKEKRNQLIDFAERFIRTTNLKDNIACLLLRVFHLFIPVISISILLFGVRHWFMAITLINIIIFTMFFMFDGCILSRIEQRFSEKGDDFTVIDPFLILVDVERTNENRTIYSIYSSLMGFIATYLIYYYRFVLTE
jgi:hypothetical protein